MTRTLHLHIGHAKTGSSYLQSCFALNDGLLERHGVRYPAHESVKAAKRGAVTGGNANTLALNRMEGLGAALDAARHRLHGQDALLSSERLFEVLARREGREALTRYMRIGGFDRARILLFIRDPDEHLLSLWGQAIRRTGETRDIEGKIRAYKPVKRVANLLRAVEKVETWDIEVLNYSRVRKDIVGHVEAWLGLASGAFVLPPKEQINRSLTLEEIVVQRALNQRFGPCPRRYAEIVASKPPAPPATKVAMTEAQRALLAEHVRKPMRWINRRLPEAQRYRFEMPLVETPVDLSEAAMSPAQRAALDAAIQRKGA